MPMKIKNIMETILKYYMKLRFEKYFNYFKMIKAVYKPKVKPKRYRYYKGGEYTVICDDACLKECSDKFVVYKDVNDICWIRPYNEFHGSCKSNPEDYRSDIKRFSQII